VRPLGRTAIAQTVILRRTSQTEFGILRGKIKGFIQRRQNRLRGGIAQLARAMALQAIGLGFKSPYLHRLSGLRENINERAARTQVFDRGHGALDAREGLGAAVDREG
jgi:hypothetical protein